MNHIFKTGILALFIFALFAISFNSVLASAGNWSKDPFGIRSFINSKASQNGFRTIPSNGALYYDSATALKICQLAGFDAVESFNCVSNYGSGRCGYDSCKDNVLARWNSNTNNFDIINACSAGNRWISSLKCKKTCASNYSAKCANNSVYWYDSCGNRQNLIQNCSANQTCQNGQCVNNCVSHAYQRCVSNSIYWFDSCGNQQDLIQYCSYGCSSGSCIENNYYYNYPQYQYNYNCGYSYCGGYSYSGCENYYSCNNVWTNYYPYTYNRNYYGNYNYCGAYRCYY